MKKKRYLVAAALLTTGVLGMTAHAGDINENEASVISAASGVFIYNGEQYVATSEAMGILYAKLCEDGIDLTAAQAAEAIAMGYANIGVGVQMEYLVSIGPVETEPPVEETESDPVESETAPVESEMSDPHDMEGNPEVPQESEYGEEGNPGSESEKETDPENVQGNETEQTKKQDFADKLIKRLRKEKNPSDKEETEATEAIEVTGTTEATEATGTTEATDIIASAQGTQSNITAEENRSTVRADGDGKEEAGAVEQNRTENKETAVNDEENTENYQEVQNSQNQKDTGSDIQKNVKKKEILV